jgi:thiamine-phosphate pyrophosphorylase
LKTPSQCHLYGILDDAWLGSNDPGEITRQMVDGGVDILQIRAKGKSFDRIKELAAAALAVTKKAGIPLIINDHPEIAMEVGADGVHIGQDDMMVADARRIVGNKSWVGKSTHSLEQAVATAQEKPDYMGFGPLFSTPTKPEYKPIGLDEIREVDSRVQIPFFCIGGIKLENLPVVVKAGARRVVVVSGILQATDIRKYCQDLRNQLLLPAPKGS